MDQTDTAMAAFRATAARRELDARRRRAVRYDRAQPVAREAARILRVEFGAARVVLFGSGTSPERFGVLSDLDLAVWGLAEHLYLQALARLLSIDPDLRVDLVAVEQARPSIRAAIASEGREL
jgi:predicted nucleotidyltransferase